MIINNLIGGLGNQLFQISAGYAHAKKIKTAVFISGTGSNLKSLIKFSKTRKSPISIDLIISNNLKAAGLKL